MAGLTYKILKRRQVMYIRMYAAFCLILAVSLGWYTYKNWVRYTQYNDLVAANNQLILELRKEVVTQEDNYNRNKDRHYALLEEINQKVQEVFPAQENFMELTRKFDDLEHEFSSANNPFTISDIKYAASKDEEYYSVLPVTLTVRSSRDNFDRFIDLVENSGSLQDQVRLMELSSVSLDVASGKLEDDVLRFNVSLNAYFQ